MDASKRPLMIPPEFATYAERHGVFEQIKRLLEQLIINRPEDPLTFLIDYLKKEDDDVPQIIIHGPPSSGKKTIAKLVCNKLRAAYLTSENMIEEAQSQLKKEAQQYVNKGEAIPTKLWLKIVEERLKLFDCIKKGWVMAGFPETREQAHALQAAGIYPKHFVLLEAGDTVLIERAAGKRIDTQTGDIYHTTFDWPTSNEVATRLQAVPGTDEESITEKLVVYHRHIDDLTQCYKNVLRPIVADQPKGDVFSQTFTFLCRQARSVAPTTPRIVLLGPTGSGKGVQAALLAKKYNIVKVSCGQLIKQAVANETSMGLACKPYIDKGMLVPDSIVLQILKARLGQLDAVSRGWVIHGYPRTREQAEQLSGAGFEPNRVFFLDVPTDSVIERLTLRYTDPITGDRYHLLYNPPCTQDVKDRLQRHPTDGEEAVRKRLSKYNAYVEEISDFYEDGQHINADQDPHTVFECIESMVVNLIPRNLGNN